MSISSKLTESKTKLETALSEINDALEEKGGEAVETVYDAADEIRSLPSGSGAEISSAGSSGQASIQLSSGSLYKPNAVSYAHGVFESALNTDLTINCGSADFQNLKVVVKFRVADENILAYSMLFDAYDHVSVPSIGLRKSDMAVFSEIYVGGNYYNVLIPYEIQLNTWYYASTFFDKSNNKLACALYSENGSLIDTEAMIYNFSFVNSNKKIVFGGNNGLLLSKNIDIDLSEYYIKYNGTVIWGQTNSKTADMGEIDPQWFKSRFQKVEYIESTGTQYIDTGLSVYNKDFKAEITFKTDEEYTPLYSYNKSGGAGHYFYADNTVWIWLDNRRAVVSADPSEFVSTTFERSGTNYTNTCNGQSSSYSYSITDPRNTGIELFRRYYSNSDIQWGAFKLKSFSAYIEDDKVAELVPCYRKSDGTIGLFDNVNYVFYSNNGTGVFLKGADVS